MDFLRRFYSPIPIGLLSSVFIQLFTVSPTVAVERPRELDGVGIHEHLGSSVSIHQLSFQDEEGKVVTLSHFFKMNRPVLLALVYYQCPSLCNLLLNGLQESLKQLDWTPGNQFELVAISINPKETPQLASKKKDNYLKAYNRPHTAQGWHFLTGEESQIRSIASELGFRYRYDEQARQFVHAATLFILTPEGKISRYLYGVTFPLKDLRFGLLEASNGRIGTPLQQILLFCFHFDPNRNSYTLNMWRIVQGVLVLQVVGLAFFIYSFWKKEPEKKAT